jgi:glycosyltransferase involved in cell wall biosynthesis
VYISIDHRRFDPANVTPVDLRAELGLPAHARLIGQVAQITPWKAQDDAIRMLAHIRRELPETHLMLVGDVAFQTRATRYDNPAYLESLHELVAELDLQDHVHFLGRRGDMPGVFTALELTVLPSWDEPFGSVTAEAMAMGTPPLVTAVGGSTEYVRDGVSGRTLPPHSPELWAEAAIELLRDPERLDAMGRTAMTDAARFTDDNYARDMLEAYGRALTRWQHRRAGRRGGRHG